MIGSFIKFVEYQHTNLQTTEPKETKAIEQTGIIVDCYNEQSTKSRFQRIYLVEVIYNYDLTRSLSARFIEIKLYQIRQILKHPNNYANYKDCF
jgi:hypothetical protein